MRIVRRLRHASGPFEECFGRIEVELQGEDLGQVVVSHCGTEHVASSGVAFGAGAEIGDRIERTVLPPRALAPVEEQVGETDRVVELGQQVQRSTLVRGTLGKPQRRAAPLGEQVRLSEQPFVVAVPEVVEDRPAQVEALAPSTLEVPQRCPRQQERS